MLTYLEKAIQIYNNYGRFNLINKNYSEAINFYTKALDLLKKESKYIKNFKNIIYPNLIDCYCIQKEYKKMEDIKDEYYAFLSKNTIEDLIAQYNQELIIIRQKSEKNTDFIKKSYFDILNKIPRQNKKFFQISALRFFANMELDFYEILEEIVGHPETPCFYIRMRYYYLSQSKTEKAKEYYEKFKLSKISVNHFALWVQNYERVISKYFDITQYS